MQLGSTAAVSLKLDVLVQQSTPAVDAVIKPETVDNIAGLDRSAPTLLAAKSLAAPVSATELEVHDRASSPIC